jgi:hypothetical protein
LSLKKKSANTHKGDHPAYLDAFAAKKKNTDKGDRPAYIDALAAKKKILIKGTIPHTSTLSRQDVRDADADAELPLTDADGC